MYKIFKLVEMTKYRLDIKIFKERHPEYAI